jgi:PAS domain S-box-containing protein
MPPTDSLVVAVTRAVERAGTVSAVRDGVCEAAVEAGYAFACFSGREDVFVTASEPDVDTPDASDAVPTFRTAASRRPAPQSGAADTPSAPQPGYSSEDQDHDKARSAEETTGANAQGSGDAARDRPGNTDSDQTSDADHDESTDGGTPAVVESSPPPQVACIAREDGYTVTVPVVDGGDQYGTLALGADERPETSEERDVLATVGSVVGQALAHQDAKAERDDLKETLRRERRQFEKLHSVAAAMVSCEEETSIYHLAIDAAENILEFDICGIDVVQDDYFVPKATSTGMEPDDSKRIPTDEGVAGESYQENQTIIVDDVTEHPKADPANPAYRSVLSVPIEGVGLFQAGATEREAFTATDAELVELLMAHVSATLQRLRSDEALRESEQKYRTLIEQSHDAVAIIRDCGFEFVNQRATSLFDRDRETLLEADACSLLHPDDRTEIEAIAEDLTAEAGRQQTFEGRIQRPNGDVRFCEFSATSIRYDDGLAVLGSIRDITERKERERDLERQNERLEEFASVVSHDLRSPINVARGSVDLAETTDDLSHLDRAADALDRMEVLVEDILQLARKGQLVDDTERVALDDVATDAWLSVDAADATLSVETDATVEADETRLRELFENLFRNAVEHGSTSPDSQARQDATDLGGDAENDGSGVAIRVESVDDGFAVEDDGSGLPADSHADVFDRGFTSTEDGTGFGLAIVESIADAHGWSVTAVPPPAATEDDAERGTGRGARFEITGCSPD